MIIDSMDWHYRDNYPDNLDKVHAATHIGIFLGWIIENNLESEILKNILKEDIEKFKKRKITGRQIFLNKCNRVLDDKFIDKKALEFTLGYYLSSREDYCQYIADYNEVFKDCNLNSSYEVEDIWENYYKMFSMIDKRYNYYKNKINKN
ncbi:hypothetical protein [Paraclostridium sordellii]|uniref:DUF7832 domain-containing protein n=1 Tax=Paraclostridium sordellii TaxID=1505 RepID=UPI0005DD86C3|nr:hypothetical protein [Paeniclostridium sordellii]CEO15113.1 Uncharacterised protein [[Clostridium] sordellii] [Paeniclostridium sordellii]CEP90058.1 Uncharacterised protein [[Clostridium] sordellii] [Paeniclostridium sordellii]CEP98358.1 Uncharacterised protein [[Clostridium] sordellii] [Paeniclostridium sordellii]CEQ02114.1 Uncharacterised protein [[Clostridium] sordellii] [Paeniclostridium sordellii]